MRSLLFFVSAVIVALVPGRLNAQAEGVVSDSVVGTYEIRNYRLGSWSDIQNPEVHMLSVGIPLAKALGERAENITVHIVGRADATPWKSCANARDSEHCSVLKNQALADRRASEVALYLAEAFNLSEHQITTRGVVFGVRGGAYRGVTVLIVRHFSAPNANIDVGALQVRVQELKGRVDSLAALIANTHAPQVVRESVVVIKEAAPISVDVGVGVNALVGGSVDNVAPTAQLTLGLRDLPVEFFLEGGYRPFSSQHICDRADVSLTAGVSLRLSQNFGVTAGGATFREACRGGGSGFTERWIGKTDGFFIGPTFTLAPGPELVFNPNLFLGWTRAAKAVGGLTEFRPQLNLRFTIRTPGTRKEH